MTIIQNDKSEKMYPLLTCQADHRQKCVRESMSSCREDRRVRPCSWQIGSGNAGPSEGAPRLSAVVGRGEMISISPRLDECPNGQTRDALEHGGPSELLPEEDMDPAAFRPEAHLVGKLYFTSPVRHPTPLFASTIIPY